jgi:hypothetical protein
MSGSSGTYGGEEKSEQGMFVGNLRERDHLEDMPRWEYNTKIVLT